MCKGSLADYTTGTSKRKIAHVVLAGAQTNDPKKLYRSPRAQLGFFEAKLIAMQSSLSYCMLSPFDLADVHFFYFNQILVAQQITSCGARDLECLFKMCKYANIPTNRFLIIFKSGYLLISQRETFIFNSVCHLFCVSYTKTSFLLLANFSIAMGIIFIFFEIFFNLLKWRKCFRRP